MKHNEVRILLHLFQNKLNSMNALLLQITNTATELSAETVEVTNSSIFDMLSKIGFVGLLIMESFLFYL